MVLTVGLIYVLGLVQGLFDYRYDRLAQLERDVAGQERIVLVGDRAAKRLEEYRQRSLPKDLTLARSLYQEWLLEQAVEAGFSGVNVSPLPGRPNGDIYYQHAFLVSANGNLEELTHFLHGLHSAGYLQRISRLNGKPIARTKDLDLSISVEALSMNDVSDERRLDGTPPLRLAKGDAETYVNAIVRRNFFAPANKPPELSSPGTQTGYLGRPLNIRLRASDPDRQDQLSYRIEGTTVEGARLDPSSGSFEWTPQELGEYEVTVCVTDNGLPAKSDMETFKITVVDPPPEAAPQPVMGFDAATQSFVTGITEVGGKRQLWLSLRTEGRVLKLEEGDELSVGTVKGVVNRIEVSQAEITTEGGQTLTVALGKSLRPAGIPAPSGG
jgi:hypothetical protein